MLYTTPLFLKPGKCWRSLAAVLACNIEGLQFIEHTISHWACWWTPVHSLVCCRHQLQTVWLTVMAPHWMLLTLPPFTPCAPCLSLCVSLDESLDGTLWAPSQCLYWVQISCMPIDCWWTSQTDVGSTWLLLSCTLAHCRCPCISTSPKGMW